MQVPHRRRFFLIAIGVLAAGCFFFFFLLLLQHWRKPLAFPSDLPFRQDSKNPLVDDVFNATLGFEKVFVINLPSRTDHRDAMLLTAAASNIQLAWVDGVAGDTILSKVLPAPGRERMKSEGNIGSWRAHLNALVTMIQQNISTALVTEDDADWDVRIKSQLHDFALSSQALTQPLASRLAGYADPTYKSTSDKATAQDLHLRDLPLTVPPSVSPYGDEWDILWLGHCGHIFPRAPAIPKAKVVHLNDETVPEHRYLQFPLSAPELQSKYPPHTRVVYHSQEAICSLTYAVTQASARKVLYELGVVKFSDPFDTMLRDICEGTAGRQKQTCLTVLPPLFNHHRPAGPKKFESDISEHGEEVREKAFTEMIRWSTRMNLANILNGATVLDDQFPDAV